MQKRSINPWEWQYERRYVQAVEVKNAEGTLYCSGQAAVHADGISSKADMKTQLQLAIENLEQVIIQAGYECRNIVRLTVYHTSSADFLNCFEILKSWIEKHGMQQATTVMEVKALFETLNIELEATLVK